MLMARIVLGILHVLGMILGTMLFISACRP
jgi:hypothetical protein